VHNRIGVKQYLVKAKGQRVYQRGGIECASRSTPLLRCPIRASGAPVIIQVGGEAWPLQDIVLLRFFCARFNHPFIAPSHLHCPHYCNAVVRLLRNIRCTPNPPFVCHIPYTIYWWWQYYVKAKWGGQCVNTMGGIGDALACRSTTPLTLAKGVGCSCEP